MRTALAIGAALALLATGGGVAVAARQTGVPSPGGSYPDAMWLARHFRPRLFFDAKERWRPLNVRRFLAEPGHQACPPATTPPAPCTPLTSLAQLTPAVDHLDLRGDGPPDGSAPTAIYAHVVRRPAHGRPRRVAIDYWWFLRYNAYSLDRHEGDWEGVTVIADPFGRRVLDVHFAAHADAWRYARGVPRIAGRRVAVYVARGDHASYPRPCRRRCRQTEGTLPEARFDGRRAWSGNTARGCHARCVKLLPTGPDGATPASWDAWDGHWGVTTAPAFPAPLTPSFQHRFRHPFAATRSTRHFF